MSNKTQKTEMVMIPDEPTSGGLQFFASIRFNAKYEAQFGQSHSGQIGRIDCSTKERPSQYSASWVEPSPVVRVKWLTTQGNIKSRLIPWSDIMYADELSEGDEAAPLWSR